MNRPQVVRLMTIIGKLEALQNSSPRIEEPDMSYLRSAKNDLMRVLRNNDR